MAVEGRFGCTRKQVVDQQSVQVRLDACTTGQDNVEWARYTPAGSIELLMNGPAAADIVEGGRYRMVLEKVEEGE